MPERPVTRMERAVNWNACREARTAPATAGAQPPSPAAKASAQRTDRPDERVSKRQIAQSGSVRFESNSLYRRMAVRDAAGRTMKTEWWSVRRVWRERTRRTTIAGRESWRGTYPVQPQRVNSSCGTPDVNFAHRNRTGIPRNNSDCGLSRIAIALPQART